MIDKLERIALVLALLLVALLFVLSPLIARIETTIAAPAEESIRGIQTQTFASARVLSGTNAVTYTAQPFTVRGTNIARTAAWFGADVFVTADLGATPTSTLVVTPQVSADGTNWADATYSFIATDISQATSVVTSTGLTTATSTLSGSSSKTTATHSLSFSADGTNYFNMTLAGEYLRFAIGYNGQVTATIRVTLKNTSN